MDPFEAIADPVRREILEALNKHPASAGEIAALFTISRPAVSRHLRVLRQSGLVTAEVLGRNQMYRLEPTGLRLLKTWLLQFQNSADSYLDALETEVYRTRRERQRNNESSEVVEEESA